MRSSRVIALAVAMTIVVNHATARASGLAYDAAIGKTGRSSCRMMTCQMFTIQTALPVEVRGDGILFALSALQWEAEYKATSDNDLQLYDRPPVKQGAKSPTGYMVYCSKKRPLIFFYDDKSGWDAFAIFRRDSPSTPYDVVYSLYWASCHHFIGIGYPSIKLTAKLGYRFAIEAPDDPAEDAITQPSDLMK